MPEAESLELRSVVEKFAEAENLLSSIREKLSQIGIAEETASGIAESLGESSGQIGEAASGLTRVLEELQGAVGTLNKALDASSEMIAGRELKSISQAVQASRDDLSARIDRLEAALPARWLKRAAKLADKSV